MLITINKYEYRSFCLYLYRYLTTETNINKHWFNLASHLGFRKILTIVRLSYDPDADYSKLNKTFYQPFVWGSGSIKNFERKTAASSSKSTKQGRVAARSEQVMRTKACAWDGRYYLVIGRRKRRQLWSVFVVDASIQNVNYPRTNLGFNWRQIAPDLWGSTTCVSFK